VNAAVDLVVQLQRGADGARRIVAVDAVTSRRTEPFATRPIVRWDHEAVRVDGQRGAFVHYPLPFQVGERLRLAGERVPENLALSSPLSSPLSSAGLP
jgi:pilus assembly protein CpaF